MKVIKTQSVHLMGGGERVTGLIEYL